MVSSDNGDLADKQVYTTGEAADICKISQQTIIRCFDKGKLKGFRVPGSKFRRIPREELIRFMRENDIPTEQLEGSRKRLLIVLYASVCLGALWHQFHGGGGSSFSSSKYEVYE